MVFQGKNISENPHFTSFTSVQFSSVAQSCLTLCDPMNRNTPGLPVHHQLPEFTQIHVDWVDDAIQPSHSLSSPSPPAFNLSRHQGLFKWVSSSHEVAKILEFQLQHHSNEHPGLIFRMGWLDLLAIQGTLKSLLQHHSSKASILRCPAFFTVQLSHPYVTTGKTIALTRWTFVGKVMCLLLNMLSRLVPLIWVLWELQLVSNQQNMAKAMRCHYMTFMYYVLLVGRPEWQESEGSLKELKAAFRQ